MKNKKGFTLIELLAVIVILAIIALIATPIVMNVIEKSKKGAAERSVDNYIDAVETKVATSRLDGNILEGEYTIGEDGNLCPNGETCTEETEIKIDMSGNKPTSGTIRIGNGKVLTTSTMTIGDYNVSYNEEKKAFVASQLYKGILCTANTSKVKALVWDGENYPWDESSYTQQEVGLIASESGAYTPGVAYTCELGDGEEETFYVLEENGDNVTLLLGRNLGNKVAWVSLPDYKAAGGTGTTYGKNDFGPITAKNALKERTEGWTKLDASQITLPSGQQIATAVGDTAWTSSNYTGTVLPTWLSSYTKFTDGAYCGYWTSTPNASYSHNAWNVCYGGSLSDDLVDNDSSYGVRPVITVLKSKLSS